MKYPCVVIAATALSLASPWTSGAADVEKVMSDRLQLQMSCSHSSVYSYVLSATLLRDRGGSTTGYVSVDEWTGNGTSWKIGVWYRCNLPAGALWVERDGTVRLEVNQQGCGWMWHAYASYMPEPPTPGPLHISLTGVPNDWSAQSHTSEKWISPSGRYVAQLRTRTWSVGFTPLSYGCGGSTVEGTVEERTYQKITKEP